MEEEIKEFLSTSGCCWRCILIYLGETDVSKFQIDLSSTDPQDLLINNGVVSSVKVEERQNEDLQGRENVTKIHCKKIKGSICISCVGLLQLSSSDSVATKFSNVIEEGHYDAKEFSIALSLPVSLGLRIHAVWAHLINRFPTMDIKDARKNHLGVLKDVWRNVIGPKIETAVGKSFVSKQPVDFNLSVQSEYANDKKDCSVLEELDKEKFEIRRKQHRKYAEGVFTRQVVENTLKETSDESFLKIFTNLPTEPQVAVSFDKVNCVHTPIYLAGRYNKYSRELPQTPWMVDGGRRYESSVQEYICNPLKEAIKSEGIKFSASGREDVDVRCLGRGRPFVIEFLNPHHIYLDQSELASLQKEINNSTDLISIRDLQLVSRQDTSNLKEGEEEKTKSYCALCFSKEEIPEDVLTKINRPDDTILHQMTPVRVLHRRPLTTRLRIVHSMKTEVVNKHFFKLYLRTQAGTYIKEFVHGDFGRTTPDLGMLLGMKVDIIALDVEDVQLDWPTTI